MADSEVPSKGMVQSEFPSQTLSDTPSIAQSEIPSATQSEVPSISKTEEPTKSNAPSSNPSFSPSTARLVVPITPFSLYLTTTDTHIDLEELESILTEHMLEQMQSSLPTSTEVSRVDLLLTDITMNLRHLKKDEQEKAMNKQDPKNSTEGTSSQTPTSQQEDAPVTTTHEISVSGDVYFAGAALPTTEQLDDVTAASFEGDAGNEFIQDLLSAEDSGLQSTVGISVPIDDSDTQLHEGFLFTDQKEAPSADNAFNTLYVVGALFVVGLLLVAAFVHRTRQAKRNPVNYVDDFVEEVSSKDDLRAFSFDSTNHIWFDYNSNMLKRKKTKIFQCTLTSNQ